ncbi:hypothetical protein ILUMI_21576 [Ignelater luminosus]|uniref:Reverse transcriptase domain-containing protein n=1 Tax=Ignelater luminosus TaxID=2038154 RepID=A0A8K0G3F5_IGNLU|nr:hypothetical protein ILUMI_21576 [Ignelater luminosus]
MGPWARDNKQKADLFAESLAEILRLNQMDEENDLQHIEDHIYEYIPLVTPHEVDSEIRTNLNSKNALGFHLITGAILKQLCRKGVSLLTYLFNATLRLSCIPDIWKVAESYSDCFENLLLKQLKSLIEEKHLIPDYQFGFRQKYSTIDQIYRITDILIERPFEKKRYMHCLVLDFSQAFDNVWHEELVHKLNKMLP